MSTDLVTGTDPPTALINDVCDPIIRSLYRPHLYTYESVLDYIVTHLVSRWYFVFALINSFGYPWCDDDNGKYAEDTGEVPHLPLSRAVIGYGNLYTISTCKPHAMYSNISTSLLYSNICKIYPPLRAYKST